MKPSILYFIRIEYLELLEIESLYYDTIPSMYKINIFVINIYIYSSIILLVQYYYYIINNLTMN